MNKFIFVVLVTFSLCHCFTSPVHAITDPRTLPQNKVGVHILNTSELDQAAKLVNSNGGDWGYVTIPIQPTDRNKDKWQSFMHEAKAKHLIPIIRITTIPSGGTWASGHDTDLVDFANFLGELDWPTENRYIILFNEVNRSAEWGGAVDPIKYAIIIKNAYTIFKERSPDFFLLGPSLDLALPNSSTSLSAQNYLSKMSAFDPLVWTYFDGWSSHSYPNPSFSAKATKTGLQSIVGYKSEIQYLKLAPKPVFITETGWDQNKVSDPTLTTYWETAWHTWRTDPNVVAVTPFVLNGGAQYAEFSLYNSNGELSISGKSIYNLQKSAGKPAIAEDSDIKPSAAPTKNTSWTLPFFKNSSAIIKLENIFRVILGLPAKESVSFGDLDMIVEVATTKKQWEQGLSDRTDLGDVDGMLFTFPQYHIPIFWMKDMHFPIDMIWISNGEVVEIHHSVPLETSDKLPTYSPSVPVNMVLETKAGWAKESGIKIGDILTTSN